MIRILESKTTDTVGKYWYYLICDEGDTKPTGEFPADSGKTIANGSRLFETGTEIRYEYNNGSWTAIGQEQEEATLIEKTITENGTYDPADDDADGYSSVTVNVPTGADTFVVTINTDASPSITADKTYSEIMTAINADSKVTFTIIMNEESTASSGYYVFINGADASDKIIMIPLFMGRESEKMGTTFLGMSSNNEIQAITLLQ